METQIKIDKKWEQKVLEEEKREFENQNIEKKEETLNNSKEEKKIIGGEEQLWKVANWLCKKNLVPKSFEEVDQVFLALQACLALGFTNYGSMILAMKNMYVFKGQVEMFGDLPLSLVQKTGELEKLDEFFVDEKHERICLKNKNLESKILSAVCYVKRKGQPEREFSLTSRDLELSGGEPIEGGGWKFVKSVKYNKQSETWKKYPKIHWIRRLRAFALKSVFPDKLQSVEIHEYDSLKHPHKIDKKGMKIFRANGRSAISAYEIDDKSKERSKNDNKD